MSLEMMLLPALLAGLGYIFYQFKSLILNSLFVSLTIEELGGFLETVMLILKSKVINENWTIGQFSMTKISTDEIKPGKEHEAISLNVGVYFGKYKDKFVLINIDDKVSSSFFEHMPRHPAISLTTFRWNANILKDFIKEVKKEEKPVDIIATGFDYNIIRGRKRHGFSGVFLPSNWQREIETLVKWFVSPEGENWYNEMHQPYKLVFLFHGVPGSGKTAVAKAIADITNRSLCNIRLVSNKENHDLSHETLTLVSGWKNDVILFDEIDKIFLDDSTVKSRIDAGTLLSILNGDSLHGQIIILSANDLTLIPESFRESLLRSRRIDKNYEFDFPTEKQKEQACSFYGIDFDDEIESAKTMADVIDLIMNKIQNPVEKQLETRNLRI